MLRRYRLKSAVAAHGVLTAIELLRHESQGQVIDILGLLQHAPDLYPQAKVHPLHRHQVRQVGNEMRHMVSRMKYV